MQADRRIASAIRLRTLDFLCFLGLDFKLTQYPKFICCESYIHCETCKSHSVQILKVTEFRQVHTSDQFWIDNTPLTGGALGTAEAERDRLREAYRTEMLLHINRGNQKDLISCACLGDSKRYQWEDGETEIHARTCLAALATQPEQETIADRLKRKGFKEVENNPSRADNASFYITQEPETNGEDKV